MFDGCWIPLWILERSEISAGAKLIYSALSRHAGENGECFPGVARLARELGMPISFGNDRAPDSRAIRRYIQELVDVGLLEKEQRGLNKSNRYFFLRHEWMENAIRQGPANLTGPDRQNPRTGEFDRSRPADLTGQDRTDLTGIKEQELKENNNNGVVVSLPPNGKNSPPPPLRGEKGFHPSKEGLERRLVEFGFSSKDAQGIAQKHSESEIDGWCRIGGVKNNPAGFIRTALEKGWKLPPVPQDVEYSESPEQKKYKMQLEIWKGLPYSTKRKYLTDSSLGSVGSNTDFPDAAWLSKVMTLRLEDKNEA
jgi:hypothetical protein